MEHHEKYNRTQNDVQRVIIGEKRMVKMEILSTCRDKADLSVHNGTLFADTRHRDNGDINKDELMTCEARYLQPCFLIIFISLVQRSSCMLIIARQYALLQLTGIMSSIIPFISSTLLGAYEVPRLFSFFHRVSKSKFLNVVENVRI